MPQTFLRGLRLLEIIDRNGPISVTEAARRLGVDKSVASRLISACETDGWIVRVDGKAAVGPRSSLLGHSSLSSEVARLANPLVHAIAGVTGLLCQAYGLVGREVVVFESASGRRTSFPAGLAAAVPLYATAAGKMVASQLTAERLDALLPADPFPDPSRALTELANGLSGADVALDAPVDAEDAWTSGIARDRAELAEQLASVRRAGIAVDPGHLHPEFACVAVAWPRPGFPASLTCLGLASQVRAAGRVVQAALTAAVQPDATPADIIAAVAAVQSR